MYGEKISNGGNKKHSGNVKDRFCEFDSIETKAECFSISHSIKPVFSL